MIQMLDLNRIWCLRRVVLWWTVHPDSKMVDSPPPSQTGRQWLTGLIVIVAVVVSYVGFARVSVEWTLAVSSAVLAGLVLFLWRAGVRKERSRRDGR